ncbi:MATE family efflux transporter [Candidatus Gracilibacteria bacterium]|nr:MATE family efflux transporter [Candidatus Gracilibacteria bacterium]
MKNLTEGSITKALISLAVPIVFTNLLHTAYQLVDTFWVGRLGAGAVAAVSLSFPIIFLMISLGAGFSIAGTILVAQYTGKGDMKQVEHTATHTVFLMLVVAALISIIGYFSAPAIMRFMGAAPEILPDAVSYLQISFLGTVFLFTFFVFQSLMRGIGETRTPMLIVGLTVLLNLILDPLFIFGYGSFAGYGVTGAAIATILTQGIATVIGMYILFRGKTPVRINLKTFKYDWPLVKKMFFLGLPASIEQSMKALGLTIMSYLVATFGTLVVATYGIGIRILSFVVIPAFGLSMAVSTMVGQNIGAGKTDRAEAAAKTGLKIAFLSLLALGVIFFIFARPIVTTFIPDDPAVIETATIFVRFLTASFAFLGVQFTLNGIFQGSGNTKISMIFSIVSLWVFEFPLSYILSHTSLNESGIWLAFPIASAISATISFTYFRMGRWKKTRIIESPDQKLEQQVARETAIEEGPAV